MVFFDNALSDFFFDLKSLKKGSITILLIMFLLLLSGCMQKVKVTYDPSQKNPELLEIPSVSKVQKITAIHPKKVGRPACNQTVNSSQGKVLNDYFQSWEGVRYRYGGLTTKGVDCSGLTQRAYKDLYGVKLPRTVVEQSKTGKRVDKNALKPGDLIFFKTGLYSRHVGIYLGSNRFIHASRSKGVIQSNINNTYWRKKYWQAKRFSPVNS